MSQQKPVSFFTHDDDFREQMLLRKIQRQTQNYMSHGFGERESFVMAATVNGRPDLCSSTVQELLQENAMEMEEAKEVFAAGDSIETSDDDA